MILANNFISGDHYLMLNVLRVVGLLTHSKWLCGDVYVVFTGVRSVVFLRTLCFRSHEWRRKNGFNFLNRRMFSVNWRRLIKLNQLFYSAVEFYCDVYGAPSSSSAAECAVIPPRGQRRRWALRRRSSGRRQNAVRRSPHSRRGQEDDNFDLWSRQICFQTIADWYILILVSII